MTVLPPPQEKDAHTCTHTHTPARTHTSTHTRMHAEVELKNTKIHALLAGEADSMPASIAGACVLLALLGLAAHGRCDLLPLVGNPAPDFEATAVIDQEFADIKLSQYRVRAASSVPGS